MSTLATPDATAAVPTQAERRHFDETGYLVLENFLTAEHVARLLDAVNRAAARRQEQLKADPSLARITLNSGKKSTRLLYILEDDPLFLELMDWPPMMPYVKGLLNPKFHHCASDAIVDYGSDLISRSVGWHIDGNDNGFRNLGHPIPLLQLKVGYYLTDMTQPGNCNLTVVPGSHKAAQPPSPEDLQRRELFPEAVQVCAPAGSAILFHNALWHTGAPFASTQNYRTMLYYAYEHEWMMACEETWHYSKDFYNRRLSPEQHKFFHGLYFDPIERRQGWG